MAHNNKYIVLVVKVELNTIGIYTIKVSERERKIVKRCVCRNVDERARSLEDINWVGVN